MTAAMQVLVEGFSKKSNAQLSGRTDTMKRVVFDDKPLPSALTAASEDDLVSLKPGDYVAIRVHACTSGTLLAQPLAKTTLQAYYTSAEAVSSMTAAAHPGHRQVAAMAC